jgi:WD40 repeat protein/tRNA A-37 threonylcarbamoyl transferase component Bud32
MSPDASLDPGPPNGTTPGPVRWGEAPPDSLLEKLLEEQRRLWQQGRPGRAADFLAQHPALQNDPEKAAALVYQEFVLREQHGEAVNFEEYLTLFAPYAVDLRLLHEADRFVHQLFSDARPTAVVPRRLGEYELLDEIGRGGMGIVYRARQQGLQRVVALKMLLAGELASPADIERFRNEARAAGQLQHPGIVAIHAVGFCDGRHFFTMDFVEGKSLAALIHDGPLAPARAAGYVRTMAGAIQYAHEHGILHRDLKPSNVLIDGADQPRITDFGLAHWLADNPKLTTTGQVLGTPGYMPPEQASGRRGAITPASDVYALGAILYELLTGRPTVLAETPLDALLQVVETEPVSLRLLNPRIPRDLETICLKCLQKEPHRRYASAAALADDLGRFLRGEAIVARRVGAAGRLWRWCRRKPLVAGLALAAALFLIAGVAFSVYFAAMENARAREATAQADRADRERRNAKREAATLALERARHLEEQGENGRALLWLTRSLALAYEAGDHDLQGVIRTNLGFALRRTHRLRGMLCHDKTIQNAAFSPDGKAAATVGDDNCLRLWDVATARPRGDAWMHDSPVYSVAFNPEGKVILTGDGTGKARLWETATGRLLATLAAHPRNIRQVRFSPDGKSFVTADDMGLVLVWDTASRQPRGEPMRHQREVLGVAFSPDRKTILTGSADQTSCLWDAATGKPCGEARQHDQWVWNVAFDPDGKSFLAARSDGKVLRWDTASGQPVGPVLVHPSPVFAVAISADGKTILTGSQDGTARLWHAATGQPLGNPLPNQGGVVAVALGPDGKTVLIASNDHLARLWDVAPGEPESRLLPHGAWVCSVSFGPDGKTVLTSSHDRSVRLWDALTGKPCSGPLMHPVEVQFADLSPDGKTALTASNEVRTWDVATGKPTMIITESDARVVCFAPDAKTILTGTFHHGAALWDAATGRLLHRLAHADLVRAVAYRWDAAEFITGCHDGKARRWDTRTGQPIGEPLVHAGAVQAVAYSPDGKSILTGGADAVARLWDAATGKPLGQPFSAQRAVTAVAFAPGGKTIATGSTDGKAQLWDVKTGLRLGQPFTHSRAILHVAFSPNGAKLATASEDRTARIWELPAPVPGEPEQIRLTVQTWTGLALDEDGMLYVLDSGSWQQARALQQP